MWMAWAIVLGIWDDARAQRWRFAAPMALLRYIAKKGSICVDGVSLTVNEVDDARASKSR
jgi:riboflavin synthase